MASARPVGRPPKLTPEQKQEVFEAMQLYIARTPDPTVVGFCAWDKVADSYDVTRDDINNWPEFYTLIKKSVQKQEAYLVQAGGTGKFNPTMAIFRLKQPVHGYTDRQDLNTQGEVTHKYEDIDDEQLEKLIKSRQDKVA